MKHKCCFCKYQTDDIVACGKHYGSAHKSLIPDGMDPEHFAYYVYSGRKEGSCVVCHKPTKYNHETHKYFRICSDTCKRKYGQIKKLNDPKVQEAMLSHRKISGTYTWSTPDEKGNKPSFLYTGSYELDFVKYMDTVKHWHPNDLMMPAPMQFTYYYDGQKRFYIPDAYIPSLDLVIEIKDGDPNNPNHHANGHPEIQAINREKEKLKKAAVNKTPHKYIVIYNKEYQNFENYLRTSKKQYLTEGIGDVVNALADAYSDNPESLLTGLIDAWKEYVKDNKLESYCKISGRLNSVIYDAIKSDKFDEKTHQPKPTEILEGLLTVSDTKVQMLFFMMDTDDEIKLNFGDPYAVYTAEYNSAKGKLLKWKKLDLLYYPGKFITWRKDEDNDRRLIVEFSKESDSSDDD